MEPNIVAQRIRARDRNDDDATIANGFVRADDGRLRCGCPTNDKQRPATDGDLALEPQRGIARQIGATELAPRMRHDARLNTKSRVIEQTVSCRPIRARSARSNRRCQVVRANLRRHGARPTSNVAGIVAASYTIDVSARRVPQAVVVPPVCDWRNVPACGVHSSPSPNVAAVTISPVVNAA